MKYFSVIIIFMIITFVQSPDIPFERFNLKDSFKKSKQSIIECILRNSRSSPNLKKYAREVSNSINYEILNFQQFINDESDSNIIKQCRRKAFFIRTNMLSRSNNRRPLHNQIPIIY